MNDVQAYQSQGSSNKGLIIFTIMMVAILEVLDSTIVNVSLPSMMPTLGASQDQITWVLTSYIVASAMVIPLTGFLSNRIGYKRLLIINVTGFMLASFLSGASQSLTQIVVFRFFQGAFGAALIPLSQAILRETFPLEEQGKAMAIWGIGIMVAPVFGPTIGGYITEHLSWRWIFYLNTPFCLLAIFLVFTAIPSAKIRRMKIDWLGIILMFIGIAALQVFLDQGNTKDWFNSNLILALSVLSAFCLILFFIRSLSHKHPAIKFAIFKDRNFFLATVMLAIFSGGLYGMVTLQPIMLETLFGYTALDAGWTMAPLGAASAIGMILVSILMKHFNTKYILTIALLFTAYGSYYFAHLSLEASQTNFFIANSIFGFGMGLFFVPLSTYALATIKPNDVTEASGLFSYGRMLGSSIGISLLSTLVSRETQINWNRLGGLINPFSNNLRLWLQTHHLTLSGPTTAIRLGQTLAQQAGLIAFLDAFLTLAIFFLLLIPFVLALRHVELKDLSQMAH